LLIARDRLFCAVPRGCHRRRENGEGTLKSLLPLFLAIVFAFVLIADRYRLRPIKDFPNLLMFRRANTELKFTPEVIFIGDSIIARWNLESSFPGKTYLNRGIGWQTTSQVLLRMHQDVVDLHPRTVVIEVGTNDLTGIVGEVSMSEIESNYQAIYEIASSNGIRVLFASILPVNEYSKEARSLHVFALHPPEKIKALNQWLRGFCSDHRLDYLDYYAAMVDGRGFLRSDLSDDGVHPNIRGYSVMARMINELPATSNSRNPVSHVRKQHRQTDPWQA
jgi:lysophospholipase L1-like esterase